MGKRKIYKSLIYTDLITIGVGLVFLAADAYSLGKLASAPEDDPSRSEEDTSEASSPEPAKESGD